MLLLVALLFAGAQMLSAQRTITGTVISADDNLGVPGAQVVVGGTTMGTTTDINGRFSINVPTDATHLVFSFMGMETQEVEIGGRTTVDVTMTSSAIGLEGVVITGFGAIRREAFTGAVDVIGSDIIDRSQTSNVTRALEGVVPGLQISGTSGQPGSGVDVRLRGVGSVNASNAPLWVVDGVPFSGGIEQINPNDIESIVVLRDAVAAALYGARGANGVILVTTRRGHGAPRINFSATRGVVSRGIPEYDVMNAEEYYRAIFRAQLNRLTTPTEVGGMGITEAEARQIAAGTQWAWDNFSAQFMQDNSVLGWLGHYNIFNVPNTQLIDPATGLVNVGDGSKRWNADWQDRLVRPAVRQEYQLSFSQGDANSSLFASLSYLDEEGIVPNTGFTRLTARLNTESQVRPWVRLELGLAGTHQTQMNDQRDGGGAIANPFGFIRNMPVIFPFYLHNLETGQQMFDGGGNPIWDFGNNDIYPQFDPGRQGTTRPFATGHNLVAVLPLDRMISNVEGLNARFAAEFNIIEGLTFRTQASFDVRNNYGYTWQNMQYGDGRGVQGRLTRSQLKTQSMNFTQLLTYTTTINRLHNLTAMIGHDAHQWEFNSFTGQRTHFPFPTNDLALGATVATLSSFTNTYRTEGFLASVNYDYDGRFFGSASVRRDASSRFHADNRWGTFWSIGAGWTISRENFLNQVAFLDVLRLRASFGQQGNDGTMTAGAQNWFPWMGRFNARNNDGVTGFFPFTMENRHLVWESQNMFNVGFDFRMFRRLSGSFEYYIRTNQDMLFQRPMPWSSAGLGTMWQNIGEMRSSGVEFQMNYDIIHSGDWRWSVGFNATHWSDRITKLAPEDSLGIINGNFRIMEGHSVHELWVREQYGIDEFGRVLWVTANQTRGAIGLDRDGTPTHIHGQANIYAQGKTGVPIVHGGINTTVSWRGFDLSVITAYSIGGWMIDANHQGLMHEGISTNARNLHRDMLNSWTPDMGAVVGSHHIPSMNPAFTTANWQTSNRDIISRSFFNLRNVTLGYTLPENIVQRARIQNLRVFMSLDNFWLATARRGMNPQATFMGTTSYTFFPTKTMTFGIQGQL